jgi:SAM-dependent methyltransferase
MRNGRRRVSAPGELAPKQRFSRCVDDYARFRPGYPPAVVGCLQREFGLRPAHLVADVGAGTGIFTRLLLDHGHRVIAVEPNPQMRSCAECALADRPGFRSVAGAAEATGLPDRSVDWVIAAQAFHWFDPARARLEFRRLLRAPGDGGGIDVVRGGGLVALIWNCRRESTPFLAAYEAFIQDHALDYAHVRHREARTLARMEAFFGTAPQIRVFDNRQVFDFEGLRGRTLSCSYIPAPDHPRHAPMLSALKELFAAHADGGRVVMEYDTRLYVGPLSGSHSRGAG